MNAVRAVEQGVQVVQVDEAAIECLVAEVEALGVDEPAVVDGPAPSGAGLAELPRCRYRLAAAERCPHRPRVMFAFGHGRQLAREPYCLLHALRVLHEGIIPGKVWRLDLEEDNHA